MSELRVVKSEIGGVIERLLERGGRQDIIDADIVHRFATRHEVNPDIEFSEIVCAMVEALKAEEES